MRIVFFGDLHLPEIAGTAQEAALHWAVKAIGELAPDACVGLGDVTAYGSMEAAIRYKLAMRTLACPNMSVCGNSDIRDSATAEMMERCFQEREEGLTAGNVRIVGMDTSHDRIGLKERQRLDGIGGEGDLILVSHQPAISLDADSLAFITNWFRSRQEKGQRILLWASGHYHRQQRDVFEGVPTLVIRALDPDKNIDGYPSVTVADVHDGRVEIWERFMTEGMLPEWSAAERLEFADALGITCYHIAKDMAFATENGVKHVEWRTAEKRDLPLVDAWRKAGGRTFSVHMPGLDVGDGIPGEAAFRESVEKAAAAGADMLTVHPPCVTNARMDMEGDAFEMLADAMAECLRPAAAAGIPVMVENNHTKTGTSPAPRVREYGCTPLEVLHWRDALEERLGRGMCAIRLDLGHARNNLPVSQEYQLGKWYALVGGECRAYHMHQTVPDAKGLMHNHHPITGWHDGMVSFDSFLWAWHTGMLHHAPVILEIREGEGAPATWLRLQKFLKNGEGIC